MSNNKQSSVDAYCNGCNAFICDELITFEETCSNCGTQIEYFEDKMSNNKQSIYDTMKSALEQFIEWLEENHPTAVPPPETKEHFFMKEKIDQQMAYNAGFTKAKNLYLDGE